MSWVRDVAAGAVLGATLAAVLHAPWPVERWQDFLYYALVGLGFAAVAWIRRAPLG